MVEFPRISKLLRSSYVLTLRRLVTTAEQHDQLGPAPEEIDSVTGAGVDFEFGQPVSDRRHLARIPVRDSIQSKQNAGTSLLVLEAFEPTIKCSGNSNNNHMSIISDTFAPRQGRIVNGSAFDQPL